MGGEAPGAPPGGAPAWNEDWSPGGEPGDGEEWGGEEWAAAPRTAGSGGPRWRRPVVVAAVAIAAAGAGAGIAVAVNWSLAPARSAAATGGSPAGVRPHGGSGSGPGGPVPGGGTGTRMLYLIGRVTAISPTSITVSAGGHTVTAALTSATRVSGRVHAAGAIRAGDDVSVQVTETGGGRAVATAVQDPPSPASLPAG